TTAGKPDLVGGQELNVILMKQPVKNVDDGQVEHFIHLECVGKITDSLPFECLSRPVIRGQTLDEQTASAHPARALGGVGRLVLKQPEVCGQLLRSLEIILDTSRQTWVGKRDDTLVTL